MRLDCYGSSYTLPSNSYLSKELVLPLAKSCTAWQFLAFEMAASWPWPSGCNPKRSHMDTHLKRRGLWRPYKETSLQINLNATCQQDICFMLTLSFLFIALYHWTTVVFCVKWNFKMQDTVQIVLQYIPQIQQLWQERAHGWWNNQISASIPWKTDPFFWIPQDSPSSQPCLQVIFGCMSVLFTSLIALPLVLPLLLTSSWLAEGDRFLCVFSALALLTECLTTLCALSCLSHSCLLHKGHRYLWKIFL